MGLNNVNWDAVAALGTWGAVLVALFLPYCQHRRKLKITYSFNQVLVSSGQEDDVRYIGVSVLNSGSCSVFIRNWMFYVDGTEIYSLLPVCFDSFYARILCPNLPYELIPGSSFSCGMVKHQLGKELHSLLESGSVQCDDGIGICVVDSFGKSYRKLLYKTVQEVIDDCDCE